MPQPSFPECIDVDASHSSGWLKYKVNLADTINRISVLFTFAAFIFVPCIILYGEYIAKGFSNSSYFILGALWILSGVYVLGQTLAMNYLHKIECGLNAKEIRLRVSAYYKKMNDEIIHQSPEVIIVFQASETGSQNSGHGKVTVLLFRDNTIRFCMHRWTNKGKMPVLFSQWILMNDLRKVLAAPETPHEWRKEK